MILFKQCFLSLFHRSTHCHKPGEFGDSHGFPWIPCFQSHGKSLISWHQGIATFSIIAIAGSDLFVSVSRPLTPKVDLQDLETATGLPYQGQGAHVIKPHHINGNFRILKWRYVSTIFLAIFWGYIPLHRPYIGLIYGRYLQSRFLKWPLTISGALNVKYHILFCHIIPKYHLQIWE